MSTFARQTEQSNQNEQEFLESCSLPFGSNNLGVWNF